MSINKAAVFSLFTRADGNSLSFAEELLALGVGDRATARPLAVEWASKKYGVAVKDGQRGLTLDETHAKYETAKQAITRVLSVCFPGSDLPAPAGGRGRGEQKSAVDKLLAAYGKLSAGEKRSFKAKLAAL